MTNAIVFSGSSTYVPSLEASGGLIVNFSRNPSKFALNNYIGIRKVERDVGLYTYIDPDESARVINIQDHVWNDGNDAPAQGKAETSEFTFKQYNTTRYAYPVTLGYKTVSQASWDLIAQHAAVMAAKAMTARTIRVLNALANASWGSNTDTATNVGGGLWGSATTTNLYIQKSIQSMVQTVHKGTNGVVGIDDLQLVINPAVAQVMSQTDEIHQYMKSSPFALPVLEGRQFSAMWGIPMYYAGVKIVVEDTVKVTSRKTATRSASYALDSNTAYLIGRPEGLNSGNGVGPTFNTVTLFAFTEFEVEARDDPNNRRHEMRVVEDTAEVVTAPISGYYLTHVTS